MRRDFFIVVFLLVMVLFVALLCNSCFLKTEEVQSNVTIASWNVQNLFNSVDDGSEYDEYLLSSGWNETQYKVRLSKVAAVLNYSGLENADIIVLNEVENESVVEDILNSASLRKRGFCYYSCCGEKDGAIKIAVISRLPIVSSTVNSIEGQRPVLEARFDIDGSPLYLLALHAKSNIGTEEDNVKMRETLGTVLNELVSLIKSRNTNCSIVVAGDFNEESDDGHVLENPLMWNVFWDMGFELSQNGSYLYNDSWEQYDNIALLKSSSLRLEDGDVCDDGILLDVEGKPDAWKRYLLSGVSDHLPVWVRLGF